MDLQGRMDLGFSHQVFLWVTLELDLGHLCMDAWAQLALSVIVADDDINDKETIIECILCHFQCSRSLHTFLVSLKVLWALMFF